MVGWFNNLGCIVKSALGVLNRGDASSSVGKRLAESGEFMKALWRDVQYGVRMLTKNPGFTWMTVLTLAVGIGVSTTLFTAFNTVALRPAPGKQSNRLVRFSRRLKQGFGGSLFSYPEYIYYRDMNSAFSGLIARSCCFDVVVSGLPVPTGSGDSHASSERVSASLVSDNFFKVLGVDATAGRTLLPAEGGAPGARPVVLVSHNFWTTYLGSDPSVVGKTILLNDTAFTIIGITPRDFVGTADPPVASHIWVPLAMQEAIAPGSDWVHNISEYQLKLVGRLKAGMSIERARAELSVLARQLARLYPDKEQTRLTMGISVDSAKFMDFASTGSQLAALIAILTAAVTMVLLIACAN